MSRFTYHFLSSALFVAAAFVLWDYLTLPIPAAVSFIFAILITLAGVGAEARTRY